MKLLLATALLIGVVYGHVLPPGDPRFYHGYVVPTKDLYCTNLPDGDYANFWIEWGDPTCTFVKCSNGNTFVFTCPAGSRTPYPYYYYPFRPHPYHPYYFPHVHTADEKPYTHYPHPQAPYHSICSLYDVNGHCGAKFPANPEMPADDKEE